MATIIGIGILRREIGVMCVRASLGFILRFSVEVWAKLGHDSSPNWIKSRHQLVREPVPAPSLRYARELPGAGLP